MIKDPYVGAMADLDGNFSLDGLAPGTYEVVGSFIGYTPIVETVTVANEVVILNFNLYVETYVIEQAAEVVAKVDRSRDVYMENIKKKSASSMDFIPVSKSSRLATVTPQERSSACPVSARLATSCLCAD